MVVELGTEVCEAVVAVLVALRSGWSRGAGARVEACAIIHEAARTLGQLSVERFHEMPGSGTCGTVRCTLHGDVFVVGQVDVDGSGGCGTCAGASFGFGMGSHVVGAGVDFPVKNLYESRGIYWKRAMLMRGL